MRRLIGAVRRGYLRVYLRTVYSCGLRLGEGLHLQVGDIDKDRMLIHVFCFAEADVHRGKRAKDRFVPLPSTTYSLLREHWATHRNPAWLFPNKLRDPEAARVATKPLNRGVVQRAIRRVVDELGIKKHVTMHTLRHSYATHLLEAGVNLRLIMGRSCGNRHCPSCQKDKTRAWLEKQTERLLPCPYFLITFTAPAKLRPFMRSHPRVAYTALFEASSEALKALAADPRHIGTNRPGFFGVLHTWGRDLGYHPARPLRRAGRRPQ